MPCPYHLATLRAERTAAPWMMLLEGARGAGRGPRLCRWLLFSNVQRGFLQREQQNDSSMEFLGSHSATFPTLAGLRNNVGPSVCHGLSGRCHVVVLLVTIERVGGGEDEE